MSWSQSVQGIEAFRQLNAIMELKDSRLIELTQQLQAANLQIQACQAHIQKLEAELVDQRAQAQALEAQTKPSFLKSLLFLRDRVPTLLRFEAKSLRVAELADFEIDENNVPIANGSNGAVSIVCVKPYNPVRGVKFPNISVAIKAMFNWSERGPAATNAMKSCFDLEYCVPMEFPHWAIVNVYNYFQSFLVRSLFHSGFPFDLADPRTIYFTMEACSMTLEKWIGSEEGQRVRTPTTDPQLLATNQRTILLFAVQMFHALEHLHSNSVFHMDLKPDNVLIAPARNGVQGSQVLLTDFGTALDQPIFHPNRNSPKPEGNDMNRAPEVLPTPTMSPINVSKNDIWAIGCILFEMIEGRHPFLVSGSEFDLNRRITSDALPQISTHWSSQIRDLVVDKLLCRNFDHRPTASEVRAYIDKLLWLPCDLQLADRDTQTIWFSNRTTQVAERLQTTDQPTIELVLEALYLSRQNETLFQNPPTLTKSIDPPTTISNSIPVAGRSKLEIYTGTLRRRDYLKISAADCRSICTSGSNTGELGLPMDIVSDPLTGNLLVSENLNHRIQVLQPDGKHVCFIGSGPGKLSGQLNSPWGLDILNDRLIVSDWANKRIQTFELLTGRPLCNIACDSKPRCLAIGPNDLLYVSFTSDQIGVYSAQAQLVKFIGKSGSEDGQLGGPSGLDFNSSGELIVGEWVNKRIQVFDRQGNAICKCGGFTGGDIHLTVDDFDRIIACDYDSHRLQIFDEDFRLISLYGTKGTNLGQFKFPNGLCLDQQQSLVICDGRNQRIQFVYPPWCAK